MPSVRTSLNFWQTKRNMVVLLNNLEQRQFTYDDVKLVPGRADFGVDEVNLSTRIADGIGLAYPLVSAPMDTVTEAELAIALAEEGGIGVIHYNLSPAEQAKQVARVKRFQSVFIDFPFTVSPDTPLAEVARVRRDTGYSAFPVTDDGRPYGKLLGLVTKFDYSILAHGNLTVGDRMKRPDEVPIARESALPHDYEQKAKAANDILLESHNGWLLIVNDEGRLCSLVTRTDIERNETFPNASRDKEGRLKVLGAVGTFPNEIERVRALREAGVDGIVIESAHAHTEFASSMIEKIKSLYSDMPVIAGNAATPEGTEYLFNSGADCVKVGVGPGSICTTTEDLKVGVAQGTAVYECSRVARELSGKRMLYLIADGGLTSYGDIALALALGADAIMSGKMFAGTKESAGEKTTLESGVVVVRYRGMGSTESMARGGAMRYYLEKGLIKVPEGVSGTVPYKGSIHQVVPNMIAGVRQSMQKAGGRDIKYLQEKGKIAERSISEILSLKRRGTSLG